LLNTIFQAPGISHREIPALIPFSAFQAKSLPWNYHDLGHAVGQKYAKVSGNISVQAASTFPRKRFVNQIK
jgi:hypothetical protein